MIKRTGDADYPRYLKCLVMGPPKSGKTTFVSTAPNPVVCAAEAGLMSVAHLNLPYVTVNGTPDLETLLQILKDDTLRARAAQKIGVPKIETVAIDTLDAYQEILKKEILKENRRTEMQQADWGKLKERMSQILKAYVSLPLNVIFTVHTTVTQDEESRQIYAPGLQGSIKDELAGYVDFSLLSFRQKETAADGTSAVRYYLKNEGDLKNPHVGNRGAGRVPEICEPNFKLLHDLTFSGIENLAPTHIIEMDESSAPVSAGPVQPAAPVRQQVAQSSSQPAPAAPTTTSAPATPAAPQPTGVPQDDAGKPINAAGITMLTKEYQAQALKVPEDLPSWSLAKGRNVARFFVAVKADIAASPQDKDQMTTDLHEMLKGLEAWAGPADPNQTPVEKKATRKKKDPEAAKPEAVPSTPPPADGLVQAPPAVAAPTVQSDAPVSQDQAIAAVEEQAGGVVIGQEVMPDAKCEECGNPVDDVEVARLALSRFRRVLCIADYKAAAKK